MRQIYEENLRYKQEKNMAMSMNPSSAQLLQLQAEALAKNGMDPLQAIQMLKSQ